MAMQLAKKFLEKLVCPVCKGKLDYDAQKEKLICNNCRLVYRIDNGVPVLLSDEAEKL